MMLLKMKMFCCYRETAMPLFALIISTNWAKQLSESCGPGLASGWYWMVMAIFSSQTMPAHVPSFKFKCETFTSFGNEFKSTAKLWFCAEISTAWVNSFLTGWLPPWCPNFILNVLPPKACPKTWCPMQMPNTGTLPSNFLQFSTAYGAAAVSYTHLRAHET